MLKTKAGDIIGSAPPDAYSISTFCAAHGISRSTFYNLGKLGKAPRLMRVGTRVLISREAAAQWRREREAETAQRFEANHGSARKSS